jgi:hypothetical protein
MSISIVTGISDVEIVFGDFGILIFFWYLRFESYLGYRLFGVYHILSIVEIVAIRLPDY